jgi:CRISPR/Cas system-associated exonuclease Cas4 (RecB family)
MNLPTLQAAGLNPIRPDFLDSSALSDFARCPSYYYLRHVMGLRRKYPTPGATTAMDWGTCWHKVLESYHEAGQDVSAGLEALNLHYPEEIQPSSDRMKRSKERMAKALFDYHERYADLDAEMEFVRHEQHFSVYSEEDDLAWDGRIDSIRRRKGVIAPWDYKTTSRMGDSYFDQFELSFQFPGYVWAARQLTGEPINEIVVDVYYTISRSHDFFRRTFRYTEEDLAEWVSNVKLWRDRINLLLDNHLHDPEAWPKNWTQCNWWYGRKCPFFDVHSASPQGDLRLEILKQDYEEVRWNPLDESDED